MMSDFDDEVNVLEPFDPSRYNSESRSSFGGDVSLNDPFTQDSDQSCENGTHLNLQLVRYTYSITIDAPGLIQVITPPHPPKYAKGYRDRLSHCMVNLCHF